MTRNSHTSVAKRSGTEVGQSSMIFKRIEGATLDTSLDFHELGKTLKEWSRGELSWNVGECRLGTIEGVYSHADGQDYTVKLQGGLGAIYEYLSLSSMVTMDPSRFVKVQPVTYEGALYMARCMDGYFRLTNLETGDEINLLALDFYYNTIAGVVTRSTAVV